MADALAPEVVEGVALTGPGHEGGQLLVLAATAVVGGRFAGGAERRADVQLTERVDEIPVISLAHSAFKHGGRVLRAGVNAQTT